MVQASILIKTTCTQREYLEKTFSRLREQTEQDYEIIFLYTGTDDQDPTATLAKQSGLPIKFRRINPDEFSHPGALNCGAREASGEMLVCLSGDAVPENERWLANLLDPLRDSTVAGVYGKHVPREERRASFLDKRRMVMRYGDTPKLQSGCTYNLFSNANSAIRRCLWEQHNYSESLPEMEDYEWCLWAQRNGYKIHYEPTAAVEHTHKEQYGTFRYLARIIKFQILRRKIESRYSLWPRFGFNFTARLHYVINTVKRWLSMSPSRELPVIEEDLPKLEPIEIKAGEIQSEGEPVLEQRPCPCSAGGMLVYDVFKFESFLDEDRRDLTVEAIHAHGCKSCGQVVAFHQEVSNELRELIDQKRKRLSHG